MCADRKLDPLRQVDEGKPRQMSAGSWSVSEY
jgi:hypothetical protein